MMEWKEYYGNPLILFNMVNSVNLQAREISILKTEEEMRNNPNWRSYGIRSIHIRNIDELKRILNDFDVIQKHRTIYHSSSLIRWDVVGITDYSKGFIDWSEISKKWADNYNKSIFGQDFILDFDNELKGVKVPLIDCYQEANKLVTFFEEQNIPFSVNFSGKKGFHVRIPFELIKSSFDIKKKLEVKQVLKYEAMYLRVAKRIKEMFSLNCLDTSTLYRRQPVKIPYSIHNTGLVALPLTKEEFLDFPLMLKFSEHDNYFLPENVLRLNLYDKEIYKDRKGFNRGMCLWKGEVKNIKKLFGALKDG